MAGPLNGRRILDLSERSPAALIACMMLADLGAEVIRAEPPAGDPVRALSGCATWLRGTRRVCVDDAAIADGSWQRLREEADVILDTAQPWTDKPQTLLRGWSESSGQVLAILTADPQSPQEALLRPRGDLPPAYGELVEARYDFMALQPGYRAGPTFLGWPMAVHGAAWLMVSAILAALHARTASGEGQVVTTSLAEGAMAMAAGQFWGTSPKATPVQPSIWDVEHVTHTQYTHVMKTAVIPQIRVEPELRAELESVLKQGETLTDFVEVSVRNAIAFRRVQTAFHARAQAASEEYHRTGVAAPVEAVLDRLQSKLDAKRKKLGR